MTDKIEPATNGEVEDFRNFCRFPGSVARPLDIKILMRLDAEKKRADGLQRRVDDRFGDELTAAADRIRNDVRKARRRQEIWEFATRLYAAYITGNHDNRTFGFDGCLREAETHHAEFTRQMEAEHETD